MDFFQNLSVRTKLFSGIFLIILIFLVLLFWQFSSLETIDKKTSETKRAGTSLYVINELSEINQREMALLLEIIQADDLEMLRTAYEEHNGSMKKIDGLYDSLFLNIKLVFPDNADIDRIKIDNFLNDARSGITNILLPYFENVNSIKKTQFESKDSSKMQEDLEIVQIEETTVTGSSASVQLIQLYRLYKHSHLQINNQYNEIAKIISEKLISSEKEINAQTTNIKWYNSFFILLALLATFVILTLVSNTISKPLTELEGLASKLAEGELPEHSSVLAKDEIGKMALALNSLTDGLMKTSEFASEIGKGNFRSAFEPLSSKDVLGNSLLEMRKSLQAANEEENKRKIEDQERNWTTEGLARFGEILRRHTENINLLSKDIIQNLVKYLNANQGGIFILNDADPENVFLELKSAYAYNREKFVKKNIQLGEGLVGGAALEKYTIYMTELPEEYIEIESGLGGANPNSLLIVPLKLENNVLGVIEIASFNQFKKYEIELVERIAESIASTLSTAKINTRTAELLEQSRIQTQEMQEQDEEMRQNMEEMIAAQEDSLRREEELKKEVAELENMRATLAERDRKQKLRIEELSKSNGSMSEELELLTNQINRAFESNMEPMIIIDSDRKIQFINSAAEGMLEYSRTEILGRGLDILIEKDLAKEIEESIVLYFQTARKGLIDKKRNIELISKTGVEVPAVITMLDIILKGKQNILILVQNLGTVKDIENERDRVKETLLSKEFDYSTKINILENFIHSNGLIIPDDIEAQSDLLTWNDKYSIELNIIDQQHKKWIDFINILYKSYKGNAKKAEIAENIAKLLDYTDYHFGFEEKYLEDFNCGNVENHKREHAAFVTTIKRYQRFFNGGDNEAVYKLIIFLNNWLLEHIQGEDKRYVECFKLNGLM